jgi:SAM-dependent methyltransferase
MESVRKYHNRVKRDLIQETTPNGSTVLDVGCGFGGDLNKWLHKCVILDACDPSSESLTIARERATNLNMQVAFFHGTIFDCPRKKYSVVCYNFSLHYIFATRDLFFKSIRAIRDRMPIGGLLIGCIPDAISIIMSTPFKDNFGNVIVRKNTTGFGNFGENIFVSLADTPFYKDGPKAEPLAYKDLLVTHLEEIGIRLEMWEPLRGESISQLYSRFIFVRVH